MPRGRPKKNETEKETVGTTVRTTLVFDLSKDNHVLVYDYLNSLQRGGKTDAVVNAIIDKATKQHEIRSAVHLKRGTAKHNSRRNQKLYSSDCRCSDKQHSEKWDCGSCASFK